jgi:hypothetical protein
MEISGLAGATGNVTTVAMAGVTRPITTPLRVSLAMPSDSIPWFTTTTR